MDAFRTTVSAAPGWEETERLILNTQPREQTMRPYDKSTTALWARRPALIGAFSLIILAAFFAVPFSQTSEIGARLTFELADPGNGMQQIDFAAIAEDPAYGIDNYNVSMHLDEAGGPLVLELLLLTEDPGAPGAVLSALTAEYPALAAAETTITPVTEQSSGTFFNHLTGEVEVTVNCEGMSAAEIENMIRQSLIERGAEGVDVQVTESADGEQRRIELRVTQEEDAAE